MLPRGAPRFHATCLSFSNMKLQQLLIFKTEPAKAGSDLLSETPVLWSQRCSYLCENISKNIVEELDINALMKAPGIEENLIVYPHIQRKCGMIQNNTAISYCNYIKKQDGQKTLFTVPSYLQTSQHVSKPNIYKYGKTDIPKDTNLPSDAQLDEMMAYFQHQAPCLFQSTGWSYRKCSYKILFENMMIGMRTESLNAYIMQINFMKNMIKFLFSSPELSILRMSKNLSDGTIHVRWQVQGIPRVLKPLSMLGLFDEKRFTRYIDGFSIFYVLNDGLYHRHVLMNMIPMSIEENKTLMSHFIARLGFPDPALESFPKQPTVPTFQNQTDGS